LTAQLINYIKYELQTKKSMGLPGLGTLLLYRKPATFDVNNTTLLPPSYKLNFTSSNTTSNSALPQVIKNDLEHLSAIINEDILKYGRSKIKNLGTFSKEENKISFTSDPNFESSYTIGLKAIDNVTVADKVFTGSKEPVVSTETLIAKKQAKAPSELDQGLKNILLYLLYGAIAAVILYALFNIKIPTSKNIDFKPKVKDTLVQNQVTPDTSSVQTATVGDTITTEASKKDTLISTSTNIAEKDPKNSKIDAVKEEVPDTPITPTLPKTKDSKIAKGSSISSSKNSSSKKEAGSINKAKSNSSNKFENGRIEKLDGRPCVIVTGSFSKSTNTVKMVKHLQSKGYKVYTESLGELTRVGVVHQCTAGSNIDSIVETIKNQINSDAWILENN
jgi:cell division septation protein DedD